MKLSYQVANIIHAFFSKANDKIKKNTEAIFFGVGEALLPVKIKRGLKPIKKIATPPSKTRRDTINKIGWRKTIFLIASLKNILWGSRQSPESVILLDFQDSTKI